MYFRKKPVVIEAVPAAQLIHGATKDWQNLPDWFVAAYDAGGVLIRSEGIDIKTLEGTMTADRADIVIRGVKGELYPCKPDIFAATYDPVDAPDTREKGSISPSQAGTAQVSGMSFGLALDALKHGSRVARAGWNGKGMWLVLDPGSTVSQAREGSAYQKAGLTGSFAINPHIDMRTATGEMQPGWLASQTDMLATDWVLI
jgi:hypothetical protein